LSIVPAVPKSSSTRPRRNTLPRPQNGAMETTASELLAAVNNAARVVAHIQKSIAPAPSPSLVPAAQPKQNAANEEDAVTSDENRRHQKEKLKKSKIHTRSLSLNEAGANGIGNGAENGSAIQNSDNATQNNTAEPVTPEHRSKKRKRSSRASENKDSAPMEFNMRPAGILEDWEFTPGVLKVPGSQNNSGNTLTSKSPSWRQAPCIHLPSHLISPHISTHWDSNNFQQSPILPHTSASQTVSPSARSTTSCMKLFRAHPFNFQLLLLPQLSLWRVERCKLLLAPSRRRNLRLVLRVCGWCARERSV
jgi:hypothetical protein